ncbi:MAG: phosphatidylglycerophosphatase A [Syntrophobacteraceae bacterium]
MSLNSLSIHIALLGGLGRSPFAPGTTATIFAGIPAVLLLGPVPQPAELFLIAAVILLSFAVSDLAEKAIGKLDPPEIVIDELAGYLVTMVALPTDFKSLFLGFVFFRLFDIWKPWPISFVQARVRGGLGIVLDDLLAGIGANAMVRLVLLFWA